MGSKLRVAQKGEGRLTSTCSTMASDNEDDVNMEGEEEVREENDDDMQEDEGGDGEPKVYLPGEEMDDDEELVCDESAYIMYHQAQTGMSVTIMNCH